MDPAARTRRLAEARLYFVCDAGFSPIELEGLLAQALAGGADVVQLRDKHAPDGALRAAASLFRDAAAERGALFIVNDRPELAAEVGADGVHVGQDDTDVAVARELAGEGAIVGLSTHVAGTARLGARRRGPGPRRLPERRPRLGDADESGPPGGRGRLRAARGRAPPRRRRRLDALVRDRFDRPRQRRRGRRRRRPPNRRRPRDPRLRRAARMPRGPCATPSPPSPPPGRQAREQPRAQAGRAAQAQAARRRAPGGRERRRTRRRGPRRRPLRTSPPRPPRGVSKSEIRNERAREALEPLAEGERPLVITLGALLSAAIALVTVGAWVWGPRSTASGRASSRSSPPQSSSR